MRTQTEGRDAVKRPLDVEEGDRRLRDFLPGVQIDDSAIALSVQVTRCIVGSVLLSFLSPFLLTFLLWGKLGLLLLFPSAFVLLSCVSHA